MQQESIFETFRLVFAAVGLGLLILGESFASEVSISLLGAAILIWTLVPALPRPMGRNAEQRHMLRSELFTWVYRMESRSMSLTRPFVLTLSASLSIVLLYAWPSAGLSMWVAILLSGAFVLLMLKPRVSSLFGPRNTPETDHPVQAGKAPYLHQQAEWPPTAADSLPHGYREGE